MITIFSIPKPFVDPHIARIQRNALASWKVIQPSCEILLMGDDEGVEEHATHAGVTHVPHVTKNELGTPLLDSAFSIAQEMATHDLLLYVNADIIIPASFLNCLHTLPPGPLLLVGRRTDLDITEDIDTNNPTWEHTLIQQADTHGHLHSSAGIDYFLFRKGTFTLPPFAVGRVGWDNWMIGEARRRHIPVIDATPCIRVIHQNHGYPSYNSGVARKTNTEALRNAQYIRDSADHYTIEDADWVLTVDALKKRHLYWIPYLKRWIKSRIQ